MQSHAAFIEPGTDEVGGPAPPPRKLEVFGVPISSTDRYEEVVAHVLAAARAGRPLTVYALAVHGLMLAAGEPMLQRSIARADIVAADGQPLRWALNALHGARLRSRVCGPELMLHACCAAAREALPVYLYGSTERALAALRRRLAARFPGLPIAGAFASRRRAPGFPPAVDEEADREDAERVRRSGARLVFVGLGCPLQELWADAQRERLGVPALCVGAAFDFHAGLRRRPPALVQAAGLEWAFRLAQDPRRLAGRYARHNTAFLVRLAGALVAARLRDGT